MMENVQSALSVTSFCAAYSATSEWYGVAWARAERYMGRRGICMCTTKQANQIPLPTTRCGICPLYRQKFLEYRSFEVYIK